MSPAVASVRERPHRVTLQNPSAPVPDTDGGATQSYTDLNPPQMWAAIEAATARDLERLASGTAIATATHVIRIPFHPQVTTKTRVLFGAREFHLSSVQDPDEAGVELVLVGEEVVP